MAQDSVGDIPTFFGNIATTQLNLDEFVIEIRRYITPHKESLLRAGNQKGTVIHIPPPKPEDIIRAEPIARVVLTFTAAMGLKAYLDEALPQILKQRQEQGGMK